MSEHNRHSIDIKAIDRNLVVALLHKHLPEKTRVWVFGSRAKGTARKYSDLDLLIDIGEKLPEQTKTELAVDFEESELPYKVDVVDWNNISDEFKEIIETDRIKLDY